LNLALERTLSSIFTKGIIPWEFSLDAPATLSFLQKGTELQVPGVFVVRNAYPGEPGIPLHEPS